MPAPKGHEAYNINNEGGRPIVYDDNFIEAEALAFREWMKNPCNLYFKEFAFERGYSPQRLSEFSARNQRFSEVYAEAKQWQEIRLVRGGLTNEFNSNFTKFVMYNVCGWVDKQETKLSGDKQNPLGFILGEIDGTSKNMVKDESE